jgi:uncharacterized protein (TIGR00106 family)
MIESLPEVGCGNKHTLDKGDRLMAIIEVYVIPLDTEMPSVGKYVGAAVEVLKGEKYIEYQLTAMSTIIEGPLPRLLSLAYEMHDSALNAGAMRVVTIIKIDERRGQIGTISSKMEAVSNA